MQSLDFPSPAEALAFPSVNRASLCWVQFESGGGSSVPLQIVIPGGKIIRPPDPVHTGYTLAGWYTDAGYVEEWSFWDFSQPAYPKAGTGMAALNFPSKACAGYYDSYTGRVVSSNNITLYAKWKAIIYPIVYYLNGGNQNPDNPDSYTIESQDIIFSSPFRPGYVFAGWYTDSSFTSIPAAGIPRGSTGKRNYWAKWDIITYTINYNLSGGVNSPDNSAAYTTAQSTIVLADPFRAGYTFAGWYDNPDFSGSPVTRIPAGSIGDRTFYARWTLDTYVIEYVLNGGNQNPDNPDSYTIYDMVFLLPPRRPGYSFAGWFIDADFSGASVFAIETGTTGDLKLFARWTKGESFPSVREHKDRFSGDPKIFIV